MTRQTIHYTVELLLNGNFNIYEGDLCVSRHLRWKNISPAGAAEYVGTWVITWAEEEAKSKAEKESNR